MLITKVLAVTTSLLRTSWIVSANMEQSWKQRWTLPLSPEQAKSVADYVKATSGPELIAQGLVPVLRPSLGKNIELLSVHERLAGVQNFIRALQYNHTAAAYFDQNKQRPLCRILSTAREIVRQGLPIKCVEAVFLGLLLTTGWTDLDRIPVGFKTCVAGHVYRHIVLAVRHPETGLWGAIGLSRRAELMDKPLKFASLADLLADYVSAYACWWHTVLRVRIGLPVPHDAMYEGMVMPLLAVLFVTHMLRKAEWLPASFMASAMSFAYFPTQTI